MSPSRDESIINSTILKHGEWTTIEDGERRGQKWVVTTETAKEYQCQIMHFSGMK